MARTFGVAFEPKQENKWNYTAPYSFVEYPKWVELADGSKLLVHNADEEHAAVGEESSEPSREALLAEARALGLNPHHKTGAEKLQQLINESKGV